MDLAKLDPPLPADPAARPFEFIGALQARVMAFIWVAGSATVEDVRAALNRGTDRRPLAYTTFLTVMRNLVRRGILSQRPDGRAHRFAPLVTREQYENEMLRHIAATFFGGDLSKLIAVANRADVEA